MAPRLRLALTVAVVCATAMVVIVIVSVRSGVGTATGATPQKVDGFYGGIEPAGFPAVDFSLPDQYGRNVTLSSYRGRVVAATFIYSTCANTCPLVVEQLKAAIDELPKPIPMLAISVDPKQDTAANVKAFLIKEQVAGQLLYLVAARGVLEPIWKRFGIQPQVNVNSAKSDHSIDLVLFDKSGRARVGYTDLSEMDPDAIAADIRTLESEPEPRTQPRRLDL